MHKIKAHGKIERSPDLHDVTRRYDEWVSSTKFLENIIEVCKS